MEGCNFKDHEFVPSLTDGLINDGFVIDCHVQLTKRITVEVGPKSFRKDVNVGEVGVMKGVAKEWPVIEFVVEHKGKDHTVDAAVNPKHLKLVTLDSHGEVCEDGEVKPKKKKLKTGYEFLEEDGDSSVPIDVLTWKGREGFAAPATKLAALHSQLGFVLTDANNQCPEYEAGDFVTVNRGGQTEVWTNRDFKAKEIEFAPDSTEFRDRYWSQKISVLAKNGDRLHPDRKHLVIESRLRTTIAADKHFSFFFVVTRSAEDSECNMAVEYCESLIKATVKFPYEKTPRVTEYAADDLPQVPIMYNPKKIGKGTKLVAPYDKVRSVIMEAFSVTQTCPVHGKLLP